MSQSIITLPDSLTFEYVVRLLGRLRWVEYADRYLIDGSRLKYCEPGGMLLCALGLRRFFARRMEQNTRIEYRGDNNAYLSSMAFYQTFGLNRGRRPGEAQGSSTYLPITELKLINFKKYGISSHIGAEIEKEARRLASLLLQTSDGAIFSQVAYALTEMVRNAVEHSRAPSLWYAGQFWPKRDFVQIVILDEGVGICHSLARNPNYRVSSDKEAISLALKPGISGTPPPTDEELFHGAETDAWGNAGYGLYVVNRLCAGLGKFSIVSGEACLMEKPDSQSTCETNFQGTAIQMHLKTTTAETIQEFISRLVSSAKNQKSLLPAS